ncbi:MAG TPA: O-antigen ligase family protein [Bryobacteraceae bacterium]|nr:O-antigen ligase family protein [Bryobacteraceae bacterium]
MIVVIALYAVFTLITVFAPLRWAIVSYLLLACVDFHNTRDSIGILNAFRGLAVPLYLLWRLRAQAGHRAITLAPIAWCLLVVYVGVASFWSYFPLAAAKLVGEMIGSLLIAFVFLRAAKGNYIWTGMVVPITAGTILVGAVQFVYSRHTLGGENRFSGFTPAQAFAAFIVALYCLALSGPYFSRRARVITCGSLLLCLLFNGSRLWFIGAVFASVIAFLLSNIKVWCKILVVALIPLCVSTVIIFRESVMTALQEVAASNRIAAAIVDTEAGDYESNGLGTLRFREIVNKAVIDQVGKSSLTELVFGHGTSNGAAVTGSIFHGYASYVDPNRMLHNEYFRVLYEWGLAGLSLWLLFLGSIVVYTLNGWRRDKVGYAKPLLIYLPALLVSLSGENIIAGAGNATSIGFLLLLGFAASAYSYRVRVVDPLFVSPAGLLPANAPELLHNAAR